MHVVMVGNHPVPDADGSGGVARVVQVLRKHLSQKVQLTMVVPTSPISLTYEDEFGKIIYLKKEPIPGSLSYWSTCSIKLQKTIRLLNPDILHFQGAHGYTALWPKSARQLPIIYTMHGIPDKNHQMLTASFLNRNMALLSQKLFALVERSTRGYLDEIILISPYILDEYPKIKSLSHHFIANPVDDLYLKQTPNDPGAKKAPYELIQIGHINDNKNTVQAISLTSELNKMGLETTLQLFGKASGPDYLQTCKEMARDTGIENKVFFHGTVPPQTLANWMKRADALLLTSKQETAPMVLAEAHCCGLPVAAPKICGMKYMIEEGKNGTFIDRSTLKENADKLALLLKSPLERSAIRASAADSYNPEHIAMQTVEVYEKAIKNKTTDKI